MNSLTLTCAMRTGLMLSILLSWAIAYAQEGTVVFPPRHQREHRGAAEASGNIPDSAADTAKHNANCVTTYKKPTFAVIPPPGKPLSLLQGDNGYGWTVVPHKGRARWSIENGEIVARRGNGYLKHAAVCQDFDLTLQIRTSPGANGGVFFRWLSDNSDRGNEIQILDVADAKMTTGSVYGIQRADPSPLTPGKWETLHIRVQGNSATTWINGVKVAHTDGLTKIRPGHIVLQMHKKGDTKVEFRNIVLTSLDGAK